MTNRAPAASSALSCSALTFSTPMIFTIPPVCSLRCRMLMGGIVKIIGVENVSAEQLKAELDTSRLLIAVSDAHGCDAARRDRQRYTRRSREPDRHPLGRSAWVSSRAPAARRAARDPS